MVRTFVGGSAVAGAPWLANRKRWPVAARDWERLEEVLGGAGIGFAGFFGHLHGFETIRTLHASSLWYSRGIPFRWRGVDAVFTDSSEWKRDRRLWRYYNRTETRFIEALIPRFAREWKIPLCTAPANSPQAQGFLTKLRRWRDITPNAALSNVYGAHIEKYVQLQAGETKTVGPRAFVVHPVDADGSLDGLRGTKPLETLFKRQAKGCRLALLPLREAYDAGPVLAASPVIEFPQNFYERSDRQRFHLVQRLTATFVHDLLLDNLPWLLLLQLCAAAGVPYDGIVPTFPDKEVSRSNLGQEVFAGVR